MVQRRPIVGVMGSHAKVDADRACRVGVWIASQGYHLLTGGGGGVMETVAQAFATVRGRSGRSIGVLPSISGDPGCRPVPGYPNAWIEIPIFTNLSGLGVRGDQSDSRNHINILTSTVVLVLAGGEGTASEARLALRYGRPCIAYLDRRDDVPTLPEAIGVEQRFDRVQAFVRAAIAASNRV